MADLQVRVAADVASAISALQKLEKELDRAKLGAEGAARSTDNASKALGKLPNVTGQATSTLTNFSRVVQDAPFGLIGIANNIDPLITSFQQLKSSTGSTGDAFKILLSQLSGPAGIALAVSTVTSLLITFGDKIFGSGKAANAASQENDKYAQSIKAIVDQLKAEKDAIEEVISGQSDLSRRRQQNVKLSFGEGTETDILLLKGQISITARALTTYEAKIAEAFEKERKLRETFDKRERGFSEVLGVRTGVGDLLISEEEFNKGLKQVQDERFKLQEDQLKAVDKLANQRLELKVLERKNLERIDKENLEAYQEYVRKTIAEAKRISSLTDTTISLKLDVSPFDDENTILRKSEMFLDKFRKGIYNYSLTVPPVEIQMPIKFSDDPVQVEKAISPVAAEMENAIRNYFKRAEPLDASLLIAMKQQTKKKEETRFSFMGFEGLTEAQKQLAETGALIANTITPSLDAMIQAVARGENAFVAFGNGVKAILLQVIQQLLATTILAGVLSALFPGGLGTAKGFTEIFGKLMGIPGRANGGPVSGGNPYVIGERGPELFVPSVSGAIVPNNMIGSFMGGRQSGGSGMSILRGQDILLAYARTQRSQLRVNG